jgi:hypothetical protein
MQDEDLAVKTYSGGLGVTRSDPRSFSGGGCELCLVSMVQDDDLAVRRDSGGQRT